MLYTQGLSILSRRQQPSYVRSFHLVLHEVALGARAEAAALARQTDTAANSLKLQAEALERREASERQAAEAAEEKSSSAAGQKTEGEGAQGRGGFPEARAFFTRRAREKAGEAGISGVNLESEAPPGGGGGRDEEKEGHPPAVFVMSATELAGVEERLRRVHAAAVLAAAAVDAAAPMIPSANLRVCMCVGVLVYWENPCALAVCGSLSQVAESHTILLPLLGQTTIYSIPQPTQVNHAPTLDLPSCHRTASPPSARVRRHCRVCRQPPSPWRLTCNCWRRQGGLRLVPSGEGESGRLNGSAHIRSRHSLS